MKKLVKGKTGNWEIVIGLEIHAQIISNSKLMSSSPVSFGGEANENVNFVDSAMPGMLPVVNEECILQAVRSGIAINAKINKESVFARKNYFYADLPQGYQISQADKPTVGEGCVEITLEDGTEKTIRVERIHVEQDAGKSIHDLDPTRSYIDLNRCGVGLMEIVSMPDISSADEAVAYFSKVRSILKYIGSCDGAMAEGSMRADVNVSVRREGETEFGTRTECKNINSMKFMRQAIEYEVVRQIKLIEAGGEVDQETRLFDTTTGETRTMRSKEDAHDYRYFPDPDLLPVVITDEMIEECKKSLPELPDDRKRRYIKDMGLSSYDAETIVVEKENADYFEKMVGVTNEYKLAANWFLSELFGLLKKKEVSSVSECPINAENMGKLVSLISDDVISGKIAKDVLTIMFEEGKDPNTIVEEKGLKQITDLSFIEDIVKDIISSNADKVEDYKKSPKIIGWFVGQVMQKTQGKANPGVVNKILKQYLDS